MDSTVTITELQDQATQVVKRAERNGSVAVCRHGRTVAFVVSRERMEAILESMEILSDKAIMKSIRDYESGKTKPKSFDPDEI
ncbi:MAG TPA: type II toxin-antitoxin system prevent-host-death family antitoxin [Verrucomicrobiae bacterium]|jgi:prevent-host-death family protein|nr:type II toxin-antitoxin system prevent-host-death family antitoxin [Verrucomicrobiae bacterium]